MVDSPLLAHITFLVIQRDMCKFGAVTILFFFGDGLSHELRIEGLEPIAHPHHPTLRRVLIYFRLFLLPHSLERFVCLLLADRPSIGVSTPYDFANFLETRWRQVVHDGCAPDGDTACQL
jgi:hypothetical protein